MDAPNDYKMAGMFMIIAGAVNIIGGLFTALVLFCSIYAMCCSVIGLFPLIAGIFELMNGIKANKGEPVPNIKTFSIVGLIAGCLSFNIIVIIMEILVLVNLSKDDVAEYIKN